MFLTKNNGHAGFLLSPKKAESDSAFFIVLTTLAHTARHAFDMGQPAMSMSLVLSSQ
jgi:hypothetical protein